MGLIVAVNGLYQSYFDPRHMGKIHTDPSHGSENVGKKFQTHGKSSSKYQKSEGLNEGREGIKGRGNIFAKDIMSKNIFTISPRETVQIATQKMNNIETHHLLVMEEDQLVGIISDRDLLSVNQDSDISVKDIMTEKVLLCERGTEIRMIARAMIEERISSIPVVNDENALVGIITKTDLLKCIVQNMPLDLWI